MMKPTIVVLTGPTCAGKSTLEKMLQDRGFARLTSITTRQPRVEEVNGVHYKFVDKPTFDYMSANDDLIERIEYEGNFYGLEATEVGNAASQGKPVVVVVEPNGRDQIVKFAQKHDWNVITVFVDNPFNVIAKRFVEPNGRDQIVKFVQKHDWNVITVFVDNPFNVIAKRFVERYTSDMVMAGRNIDSVMKRYTNRIASMLSTEAKWRAEAHTGLFKYDAIISLFTEENTESVVTHIAGLAGIKTPLKRVA